MAKIRGVKPEFWTDEDVCDLSAYARLLFIGIWNWACDNGHLQDKPKQIKRRVLPDDDVNAAELIREIEAKGLIIREDGWITVPNLTHHQKPDKRYWLTCDKEGCERPEGTDFQRKPRSAHGVHTPGKHGEHTEATPGAHVDGDGDGDGDGEKKKTSSSSARKRATRLNEDWRPSTDIRDKMQQQCPNVDQNLEFWKFQNYWMSKGGKEATKTDWERTYANWILTASERQTPKLRAVGGNDQMLVLNEHMPDPGPPTW